MPFPKAEIVTVVPLATGVVEVVCTTTLTVCVVLVACRFADGKNAQLAPAGSPVQLNATAAVKVPVVPKVKLVALLGFPGTAVTEPGDGAPKMKSPTLTVTCDA